MPLERQADVSDHDQMVENARWVHENVLFVTVHVVGSNNGFERTLASAEEYFARNAANLDWIAEAFAMAERDDLSAIVFAFQANPLFEERQLRRKRLCRYHRGIPRWRDRVPAAGAAGPGRLPRAGHRPTADQ